jgi:TetR/AcrR family transcriptional regulator, transcriptional repressor of bet genes
MSSGIGPALAGIPEDRFESARWREIINAASDVIARRGLANTRLKDVAEAAGVSLGLVQHYFRHRDLLITETFTTLMGLSIATWQHVSAAEPDPVRRLFALLRLHVSGSLAFERRWAFWVELWSAAQRDAELHASALRIYADWHGPFEETLADGVGAGVFRPGKPVSVIAIRLTSLIDGLAVRRLIDPGTVDEITMSDQLVDAACLELGIQPAEQDCALAGLPKVIGMAYPGESAESPDIDWSGFIAS